MASPVMIEVSPRLSMSTETCPAVCQAEMYESKALQVYKFEPALFRERVYEFTQDLQ